MEHFEWPSGKAYAQLGHPLGHSCLILGKSQGLLIWITEIWYKILALPRCITGTNTVTATGSARVVRTS